ncbi:TRAP transporter large permease [Bacillus sp. FJAT-45350]|uniref:TRAP transporter large permease n=1 Tax=Bacillus sp. FJAT-45350 TaxID=2011014 RepID=UPI000BB78EAF|nr:TRAP transporter large permease [Bacillus sp. FJAT-45350]
MIIILLIIMIGLFLINVPVAFAIALGTIITGLLFSDLNLLRLVQTMFSALDSFPLMAVPFFILAGKLMEHGGISQKIVEFASSLVGNIRGGLAHVSIMACMLFGAISGSSVATIIAIGGIMIPYMVKQGYDRNFASAVQAAGGTTGMIIPPSIPMVLIGVIAGVSVGDMFIAGIIPGLLIGFSLMIVAYIMSKKKGYGDIVIKSDKSILQSLRDAIWALLMPVIILGGIYGGIFTPTEASVVAVIYGLLVGIFIYRKINFSVFKKILHSTVLTTSAIGIIIATASYFGKLITLERVPHDIAAALGNANLSPLVVMLLISAFLLVLGTFLDAAAALIIATPLLLPIAVGIGMDPVHFGIIMVVNLSIGLLTPPLGVGLFVASKIGKVKYESILKPVFPFILILIIDVIIITLFPQISVGFANLMRN